MFFRDLTADEIECRVQSVKENGLILLLYRDSRTDMRILDESVGPENWQREHYEIKGNLFCRVGIRQKGHDDRPNDWVWKADCGSESNTDPEKGESSDSFKRACTSWGIARELYTPPVIWIPADKCNIKDTGRKDKYNNPILVCKDNFSVEKIIIENKRINALAIWNTTKNVRAFVWQRP